MSELNITKLNPTLTLDYILDPNPDKDVALELDTYGLSDIKRNKDIKNQSFVLNDQYLQVSGLLYEDIQTLAQKLAENVITIEEYEHQLDALKSERDALQNKLDSKTAADAELDQRVKLVEKTVSEAETHLAQLKEIRQSDTARIKALHEERNRINAELTELHTERDALQEDIKQLRIERDALIEDRDRIQSEKDAVQAEKDELAADVEGIRQDVQQIIKQFQARMAEAGVNIG